MLRDKRVYIDSVRPVRLSEHGEWIVIGDNVEPCVDDWDRDEVPVEIQLVFTGESR